MVHMSALDTEMTISRGTEVRSALSFMAIAGGIAAANLYYVQTLLPSIASGFNVGASAVALLPSMTQIGLAIGLVFIVPLADVCERKRLLIVILLFLAAALLLNALAPNLSMLFVAAFVLGLVGVAPQLLSPFAAVIAPEGKEGASIGVVLSGILSGIVMSRIVAGGISGSFGWRTAYLAASGTTLIVAMLLGMMLPENRPRHRATYWSLIASSLRLLHDVPDLRRHVIYGSLSYASFMSFWSTYAIHVQASFGLGAAAAGLFGLAGAAGIGCAGFAGGQVDRGRFVLVSVTGSMLMVLGFGVLAIGNSILLTAVGALLLDGGAMATHAANQSKALALRPEAVARTNSVYIAVYFIGGAIGTIISGVVMTRFGWLATCVVGAGFPIVILLDETIRGLSVEKRDFLRRESGCS